MKLISESTPLKILVERNGLLLSFTTKKRAYFIFLTAILIGLRVAPTTDPYPGVVEISGYDILTIVRNWHNLANIRLRKRKTAYTRQDYENIALREFKS